MICHLVFLFALQFKNVFIFEIEETIKQNNLNYFPLIFSFFLQFSNFVHKEYWNNFKSFRIKNFFSVFFFNFIFQIYKNKTSVPHPDVDEIISTYINDVKFIQWLAKRKNIFHTSYIFCYKSIKILQHKNNKLSFYVSSFTETNEMLMSNWVSNPRPCDHQSRLKSLVASTLAENGS